MTPEIAKRLAFAYPGLSIPTTGVVGVAGVADVTRYARKSQEIRQLRPLRLESDNAGKTTNDGVAAHVASPAAPDLDAIEERAALAADRVPPVYLDVWARLNCQKPASVSEAKWRLALDDGGRFLDAWGADAAAMQWSAGSLFDLPREGRPGGLVWQLRGECVNALGEHRARLADGRTIERKRL